MQNAMQLDIMTPHGKARDLYHHVEGTESAVVMVSGALGGMAGPSDAYPALVGWSFGGAVVISPGVAHSDVLGVATLASQTGRPP
jgi:hypothetical protein